MTGLSKSFGDIILIQFRHGYSQFITQIAPNGSKHLFVEKIAPFALFIFGRSSQTFDSNFVSLAPSHTGFVGYHLHPSTIEEKQQECKQKQEKIDTPISNRKSDGRGKGRDCKRLQVTNILSQHLDCVGSRATHGSTLAFSLRYLNSEILCGSSFVRTGYRVEIGYAYGGYGKLSRLTRYHIILDRTLSIGARSTYAKAALGLGVVLFEAVGKSHFGISHQLDISASVNYELECKGFVCFGLTVIERG